MTVKLDSKLPEQAKQQICQVRLVKLIKTLVYNAINLLSIYLYSGWILFCLQFLSRILKPSAVAIILK
jgi:hypothetical protein